MKTLIIMATIIIALNEAWAYSDTQIVNAIYRAEGGSKATWAYGIRSVNYTDVADARRICYNTVRNNRTRWNGEGDFIAFLGSRYCPVDKINWTRNVNAILERS